MKKVAAIYSPLNIDSTFAAAIIATNAIKDDFTLKTYQYIRSSSKSLEIDSDFDEVYILGADLKKEDIARMIISDGQEQKTIFHYFTYSNTTGYKPEIVSKIAADNRFIVYPSLGDDGFEMSVSSRVCNLDNDCSGIHYTKGQPTEDYNVIREYAGVVSSYMRFDKMTADETLFLFSNIVSVKKAADMMKVLILDKAVTEIKSKYYSEYVQDVRHTVKSNMLLAYYPGANGMGFHTPTLCVNEKDAYHAMRFINYAYDEVISYEDTNSARVYRVLSKENLQWYIKRFEPRDVWSEGHLTYLKTELLQHIR